MDDYATPESLAAHLLAVANNETLYLQYHAWRKLPHVAARLDEVEFDFL